MKLLSFDADQTLIDFHKMRDQALEAVCQRIKEKSPKSTFTADKLTEIRNRIAENFSRTPIPMLELRRMGFYEALKQLDICGQEFLDELMELFQDIRFNRVSYYPETIDVLKDLKKDHKLVLITNGNSDPSKMGFGKYFDSIILGENYSYKKPDERIFAELFQQGVEKKDIFHVGDSLSSDIEGANNVGINSIWINRTNESNNTEIRPKFEISNLKEIDEILANH